MTVDQGRALRRSVARFCVPALLIRTLSRLSPSETLQADFLVPFAAGALLATARNKLKSAQHRPSIIAACWVQAGLW